MRGKQERIYLLDMTLLDSVGGTDSWARRQSCIELVKALSDLGIDYIASRVSAEVTSPGRRRLGARVGSRERTSAGDAATSVWAWHSDSVRRDPPEAGLRSLTARDAFGGAGAVLLTIEAGGSLGDCAAASPALDAVGQIAAAGREVIVEISDYFEAHRSAPEGALASVSQAAAAGARWIVLADTSGTSTPDQVGAAVGAASGRVSEGCLGIVASNARGRAVANTLAALRAGCRLAGGTLSGAGRPGGQASLATVIPTLLLNGDLAERFVTRVTPARLVGVSHAIRLVEGLPERDDLHSAPTRVIADAAPCTAPVLSSAARAEPFDAPLSLNRSAILRRLSDLGIAPPDDEAEITRLLEAVAARDRLGYGLTEAEASFELVVRRALGAVPCYFSVVDFRVGLARRRDARGRLVRISDAEVSLKLVGADAIVRTAGGGKGPVDALDSALRASLGRFQALVSEVELADYWVRILRRGGEAMTRVAVENHNRRTGARWLTVGVAPSIVDASLEALVDGLTFCLLKGGVRA